jgi:FAD/FMN-containing dehydrogenase
MDGMAGTVMKELFLEILSSDQVLSEKSDLCSYGKDWAKGFEPDPALILLPKSYDEVQQIVRICYDNTIGIVPSGGRTGLSAGATATAGEVILSLERLNQLIEIEPIQRTLTCQAGMITEKVQETAREHDLYFPIDLASAGSSQIGGNVATNAGGLHVIRYGNTRNWVLGMKVVTGTGELLSLNGELVKNQSGYDLRNLIVGSEGTLAVIVELTLKLAYRPRSFHRALCATHSMDDVLQVMTSTRSSFERVSAFEFFTRDCLECVLKHHPMRNPFEEFHPYYALVEVEDLNEQEEERFNEALLTLYEGDQVRDVVVAQSSAQSEELLLLRERIGETTSSHYTVHKNDLSVPIRHISPFMKDVDELAPEIFPDCEILLFGHVGDGNLHVNILKPDQMDRKEFFDLCHKNDHQMFGLIQKYGGSVSAEHGIGLLKKPYLHYCRSKEEIAIMRGIKKAFDPNGILNPGKIFSVDA